MLLDSGATESYIDENLAKEVGLTPDSNKSCTAMASTQFKAEVLGMVSAKIEIFDQTYNCFPLGVMKNLCCNVILGQNFMKLHKEVIFQTNGDRPSIQLCNESYSVISVAAAKVDPVRPFRFLDSNIKPIATRSRKFNSDDRLFIKQEIENLLKEGIIEPASSPWRAQVLVTKDERHKRRMVVDYSQTINRFTHLDAYPLPKIDHQINSIAKCKIYSTLDLKSAYYQIPLLPDDRPMTGFEANGKLYQYCRLPFGVTNGVSVFQRTIDNLIAAHKLENTYAYLDNITVVGKDQKSHDANLEALMNAADKCGLTFNKSKSVFSVEVIDILGYRVSHGHIKPDPERLRPLIELPIPRNTKELKRCMGMFAYYARWIPNFSEKIKVLSMTKEFPLVSEATKTFDRLRQSLVNACLRFIDEDEHFTVECDASDFAIAATLNQKGRPVAFMSRTLSPSELRYPSVEKEATSIIEAVRRWGHYLHGKTFTLVTDQKSLSYMLDQKRKGKIKNAKIQSWRVELGTFSYNVVYRPGDQNLAPDALSRIIATSHSCLNLSKVHEYLGHPGVTRLYHFTRSKNLPYSISEIRSVCSQCKICAELKPQFFKKDSESLIKATQPWDRLSLDFKGPVKSSYQRPYLLVVVDEFSRFPFVFPCKDTSAQTVIRCLNQLFSIFGLPAYIHSDRGSAFMSQALKQYLVNKGVATSKSTPYHPQGNSQCERTNQTVWKTIKLLLKNNNLSEERWETVLPSALHAIRSLLCTATNQTPHERFFRFQRRSGLGKTMPSFLLNPGTVLLRRFVRTKSDPLCDEVELLEANPSFCHVRYKNGKESTVSTQDLAPFPQLSGEDSCIVKEDNLSMPLDSRSNEAEGFVPPVVDKTMTDKNSGTLPHHFPFEETALRSPVQEPVPTTNFQTIEDTNDKDRPENATKTIRRSTRNRKPPDRYCP